MRDSLRDVSKAARSIKTLTDMLDNQPQSLIFGKPSEGSKK
jgi:paraquat-inducible protein B